MRWPFSRKPGAAAAAPEAAADHDRTDPLGGSAWQEEAIELARSPLALLEAIKLSGGAAAPQEYMRLQVLDAGLAPAWGEVLLGAPERVTGLRDLLAGSNAPLCAALEPPGGTLQQWLDSAPGGVAYLRPRELLAGLADVAELLAHCAARLNLVWSTPAAQELALAATPRLRFAPGLDQCALVFYGWCGLNAGDAVAAAQAYAGLCADAVTHCCGRLSAAGLSLLCAPLAALAQRLGGLAQAADASYAAVAQALSVGPQELACHGATDPGQRREHNEDAYLILSLDQASGQGAQFALLAVADGMGGHASGEVASSLALDLLRQYVLQQVLAPRSTPVAPGALAQALALAAPAIDRALLERAQLEPGLSGMGTTLIGYAALRPQSTLQPGPAPGAAHLFWTGDSRAYLAGPGGLARLSVDHSYVQDLIAAGEVSPEEAFTHPMKNVITRCLGGAGHESAAQLEAFQLGPGELLILCSDGLSDALRDSEIAAVLRTAQCGTLPELAQALIAAANAAGGPDNITVVLAQQR